MIRNADGADIIFIEGYKKADIPKVFMTSDRTGYELPDDASEYRAIISDDVKGCGAPRSIPVFDRDDINGIAGWIKRDIMGRDNCDNTDGLTHFDSEGNARMVNVSDKDITVRTATAGAKVILNRTTFELIKDRKIKKGDVLTVAQIAGIMGAKKTPELIPMCHPLLIDGADVRLTLNEDDTSIDIEAVIKCTGRTGVEMEAICACSVAAMTVYDMCKSVQRDIVITDVRLLKKTGGVHGDYVRI
jgi:cyclic pyranopterin phosphate synthase